MLAHETFETDVARQRYRAATRLALGVKVMDRKLALTILATACAAGGISACAQPEVACAQLWKNADANNDGVLTGPEDDRYLAYARVRAGAAPVDGRITRAQFMNYC